MKWYFGLGGSLNDFLEDRSDSVTTTAEFDIAERFQLTHIGMGATGFLGFSFNRYLSTEINFRYQGNQRERYIVSGQEDNSHIKMRYMTGAISGIGSFPVLKHFGMYARLGIAYTHLDYLQSGTVNVAYPQSGVRRINFLSLLYGFGLDVPVWSVIGLRLEYQSVITPDTVERRIGKSVPGTLGFDIYVKY